MIQVMTLAIEQAYPSWMEYDLMLYGWALTVEWHGARGIATLRQGLSDWQRRGTPTTALGAMYAGFPGQ